MKSTINLVVTCYKKRQQLHWQQKYPLTVIEEKLSAWCTLPNETISIRTFYQDAWLLPDAAMSSAVDINLKKLTAVYRVRLVANKGNYRSYRNYKVTYSNIEDLVFSVMNYLTITQDTTMTYSDILTSGEN